MEDKIKILNNLESVILIFTCVGVVIAAMIYFNVTWHKAAVHENSHFDKKEVVQNFLGNLTGALFLSGLAGKMFDWGIWLIVVGGLLTSVGIAVAQKVMMAKIPPESPGSNKSEGS